jgi:hypothetical protein
MSSRSEDLSVEEEKVLDEALSVGDVGIVPTDEYAADLRCRLLNAASAAQVTRARPKRRVLMGSILGAGVAAIVLVVFWFSNGEPAWASAIRMAREQAWIHARIERENGSQVDDIWVSPERDIVAAWLGTTAIFQDYRHATFLRYDDVHKVVYRMSQPENTKLGRDLMSVSSLASLFRRSPGVPELVPHQSIQNWSVRSTVVDELPCREYEIVIRPPDGAAITLFLAIDSRQSLPRLLRIEGGDSRTMACHFEYPPEGPLDAGRFGIPTAARRVDVDESGELFSIAQSLREGRRNFDDYTALSVTSFGDDARPLAKCEVKRVLRRGDKWRVDGVTIPDANFALPKDRNLALGVLRAQKHLFGFAPEVICDGHDVRMYKWEDKLSTNGEPLKVFTVNDDSTADSLMPPITIPERSCRPLFQLGGYEQVFEVSHEKQGPHTGLIKVDGLLSPYLRNSKARPQTYWLDSKLEYSCVRTSPHQTPGGAGGSKTAVLKPRETELRDFSQSPRGFWYPSVVDRDPSSKSKRVTRFYVDFSSVPSDDLFGPVVPTP